MLNLFTTPISSSAQKHLAVLINAANASTVVVVMLFEEIAKYGDASVIVSAPELWISDLCTGFFISV